MTGYFFNPFAVPNLFVALGLLLWGLLLRWRESDSDTGSWALAMGGSAALWLGACAAAYCASTPGFAKQWITLSQTGVILLGPTLYELLRRLLGLREWRDRLSPIFWIAAAFFIYLLHETNSYLAQPYHYWWGFYPHYRIGGTLQAADLCGVMAFLFFQCWRTWRQSPFTSTRRHRARILLIGFGIGFTAAVDFLPCWGVPLYPFGYLMVGFTIFTIGFAAWRYRAISVTSRAAADQVLKTLSDGVVVLDDLGVIALVNTRAMLLLNRSAESLYGKMLIHVFPEAAPVLSPHNALPDNVSRREIEVTGPQNGSVRIIEVTVNTMRDARGASPLTVLVLRDVTHYREALDQIRNLVYFDQLTGLANRRYLRDSLERAVERCPIDRWVAVCALRLERIPHVADHATPEAISDAVLKEIARRLQAFGGVNVKSGVTVGYLEGHEFAIILEQVDSVTHITTVLADLQERLHEPVNVGSTRMQPAIWAGVSLYPEDGYQVERLLDRAAAAADQAADTRDGRVHFYSAEKNAASIHALLLSGRLAHAIEADELCVHFQPIVNASTGAIEFAETLVRWDDPMHGLRFPNEFVPIAEQSGLIAALDRWVLTRACAQASGWSAEGAANVPSVSVNLSGAHLAGREGRLVVGAIQGALENSGLSPTRLVIEITETRLVEIDPAMLQSLQVLRERGVRIAVDDFGTGYASLSYLERLPLDKLKIDKTFVAAIGRDERKEALLESILMLALRLGLTVVAEGVESADQAKYLISRGCHLLQGYLFSHPVPPEEFARLTKFWSLPLAAQKAVSEAGIKRVR